MAYFSTCGVVVGGALMPNTRLSASLGEFEDLSVLRDADELRRKGGDAY